MPRTANPYMADAGRYNAISEGVNNLANVFLNSQPDPVKSAQAQASAWQGRESRENVQDTVDARRGRQDLGNLLRTFDPGADNREMVATGVGTGSMEVGDLGNLYRVMQANFGGSDDQVMRSVIGAGGSADKNSAYSMGGQQNLADRDFGYEQSLQGQRDGAAMQRLQARFTEDRATAGAGGAGGGAGTGDLGGVFGLSPDQNRYLDAQETMRGELSPILQSYGVPVDGDGNLRTDLLPTGYFEGVMQQATDAARADNFTRDISFYLDNAVRSQEQVPVSYTEDDKPNWPGGSEMLRMGAPEQGPDPRFMELFGEQSESGPVQISSDAEYDALPSGTAFVGPDGVRRRKP